MQLNSKLFLNYTARIFGGCVGSRAHTACPLWVITSSVAMLPCPSGTASKHPQYKVIMLDITQGRGVHVTGVRAAYTFKLNKNILSE
jgi:hypothetical protein